MIKPSDIAEIRGLMEGDDSINHTHLKAMAKVAIKWFTEAIGSSLLRILYCKR